MVLGWCWMEGNARKEDPIRGEKDRAGSGSFRSRSDGFNVSVIVNERWYGAEDAIYSAGTVLDGGGARDQDPSGRERIALVRDRSERVPVDLRPGGLQMRVGMVPGMRRTVLEWCRMEGNAREEDSSGGGKSAQARDCAKCVPTDSTPVESH